MGKDLNQTIRRILKEQMDPTFAYLFSFAVVSGGVYALYKAIGELEKSLRSKISPLKLRLTKKEEQKTLLDAFNLNKSQPLSAEYEYFVGKKINFQVYCSFQERSPKGNLYLEITKAKYIVLASPKNHLRSTFVFECENVENGKKYLVKLLSNGENYFFTSEDSSREFGCNELLLSNHNFYKHIVKDLDLVITDFPITYTKNITTDF